MGIAIVGGGFWGCAVSRKLTEAGVENTVYDDGAIHGASRNAAGICKTSWYKQGTVVKMMDGVFDYDDFARGFEWMQSQVKIERVPETFINVPRGTVGLHDDNWLSDPDDFLAVASRDRHVEQIAVGGSMVTLKGLDWQMSYEQVVVCAGAATDMLLSRSGLGAPTQVRPLLGRAIMFDTDMPVDCMTMMIRPYVHYTFRQFGGRMRGGDTVERRTDDKRLEQLIALARSRFGPLAHIESFGGVRPVCEKMYVGRVGKRVIAATGGHRVGFGLAGAVADRVLALL